MIEGRSYRIAMVSALLGGVIAILSISALYIADDVDYRLAYFVMSVLQAACPSLIFLGVLQAGSNFIDFAEVFFACVAINILYYIFLGSFFYLRKSIGISALIIPVTLWVLICFYMSGT